MIMKCIWLTIENTCRSQQIVYYKGDTSNHTEWCGSNLNRFGELFEVSDVANVTSLTTNFLAETKPRASAVHGDVKGCEEYLH